MPNPKVIATFSDYAGMIDAMRARAVERRIAIAGASVAEVSGLPSAYIAKLLSVHPVRRVGMISLGPLLGVLGVKFVMVEDQEAIAKYSGRIDKRNEKCAHNGGAVSFTFSRRHMQKIGQKGQEVWQKNKRKKMHLQRRISAMKRRAAMARWNGK